MVPANDNAPEVIQISDARKLGLSRYFTGRPCKYGHVSLRITSSGLCTECVKKYDLARGPKRRSDPQYKKKNRQRYEEKYYGNEVWRAAMLERGKKWREENKSRHRRMIQEWEESNPHKRAEKLAKYRAAKLQRTLRLPPDMAEKERQAVERFYIEAKRISEETGIPHEVDHIIPLQGRNVSGLHVSWNLQVIPANDNKSKGNRFDHRHYELRKHVQ